MATTTLTPVKFYHLTGHTVFAMDASNMASQDVTEGTNYIWDINSYLGLSPAYTTAHNLEAYYCALCFEYDIAGGEKTLNSITIPCSITGYHVNEGCAAALSTQAPGTQYDGSPNYWRFGPTSYLKRVTGIGSATSITFSNINATVNTTKLYVYLSAPYYEGSWYITYAGSTSNNPFFTSNGTVTYTPSTCTVSYNANGGSPTPSSQTANNGSTITLASAIDKSNSTTTYTVTFDPNDGSTTKGSQTATRTTISTFNGWHENSVSGTVHAAGSDFTPTTNITMYAGWNLSYTNTGVTFPTSSQCTRSGYILLGFASSSSATAAEYSPGDSYNPTANKTFYAIWRQILTYTITYNGNGGECNIAPTPKSEGVSVNISNLEPTKAGYQFVGWSKWKNGPPSGTGFYLPGAAYATDANLTLYAIWKLKNYNCIYVNGAPCNIYIYNGTSWVRYNAWIKNGNSWTRCGEDMYEEFLLSNGEILLTSNNEEFMVLI